MDNKTLHSLIATLGNFSRRQNEIVTQFKKLKKICVNVSAALENDSKNCSLLPCLVNSWELSPCCQKLSVDDKTCAKENLFGFWVAMPSVTTVETTKTTLQNSSQCASSFLPDVVTRKLCVNHFVSTSLTTPITVFLSVMLVVGVIVNSFLFYRTLKNYQRKRLQNIYIFNRILCDYLCYLVLLPFVLYFIHSCPHRCFTKMHCYIPVLISRVIASINIISFALYTLQHLLEVVIPPFVTPKTTHLLYITAYVTTWLFSITSTAIEFNHKRLRINCDENSDFKNDGLTRFTVGTFVLSTIFLLLILVFKLKTSQSSYLTYGGGSEFLTQSQRHKRRQKLAFYNGRISSKNTCHGYFNWLAKSVNSNQFISSGSLFFLFLLGTGDLVLFLFSRSLMVKSRDDFLQINLYLYSVLVYVGLRGLFSRCAV